MGVKRRAAASVACLAAVLLIAAACGDSSEDGASVQTEQPAPPQDTAALEPVPQAPSAAVVAETAPPPAGGIVVEPPPPAAADDSAPPAPVEAPPADPSQGGGDLSPAEVQRLVDAASAAHEATESLEYEVSLSIELTVAGMTMTSAADVPFGRVRRVGPLTWTSYDLEALSALEAMGEGPSAGGGMPVMEFVGNDETGEFYAKLEPLLEGAPPGAAPDWLDAAVAGSDAELGELWLDAASPRAGEEIPVLADFPETPGLGEYLALVEAAIAADAVLEAEHRGADEVAGAPVQAYRLVLDLAAVSERLPDLLGGFLGEDEASGIGAADDLFSEFPGPMAAETILAVDGSGAARRLALEIDLGSLFAALFGGFDDMGGEAETSGAAEFEYLLATRLDVLALNDPSLTVPLPGPAQVITPP